VSNVFKGIDPATISVDRDGTVVHQNDAISAAVASVDVTLTPLADNGGTCVNSGTCTGSNNNCTNNGNCTNTTNLGKCIGSTTTPPN
jgi:hypothetical protein